MVHSSLWRQFWEQRANFFEHFWVELICCLRAGVEALCREAFGIDDLMAVKQDVVVGDRSAFDVANG